MRRAHADGLVVWRSPALEALGVPHAFTTRLGLAPHALELEALGGAHLAPLRDAAGLAADARIVGARQVHGARVCDAEDALAEPAPEADALVTGRADRALVVRVADCVPVLLASADGTRVAAAHAGWRGLVAGVLPAALDALGGAAVAALGPSLCRACCEMGDEVVAAFVAAELEEAVRRRAGAKATVDLRAAASLQLARAGVATIDASERCSWEDEDELFSYRRDVTHRGGTTGRMGALVAPAAAAITTRASR